MLIMSVCRAMSTTEQNRQSVAERPYVMCQYMLLVSQNNHKISSASAMDLLGTHLIQLTQHM